MPKITKFYLDSAKYLIGDDKEAVLLRVDYKNNVYSYSEKLKKEVGDIAQDLLKRKHGVNFADKIRI